MPSPKYSFASNHVLFYRVCGAAIHPREGVLILAVASRWGVASAITNPRYGQPSTESLMNAAWIALRGNPPGPPDGKPISGRALTAS